ncbi:methyl-accepting chemotaxis protein [Bdellovibrionota bacterium FG-2]
MKNWSLKNKLLAFGIVLVAGGTGILGFYLFSMKLIMSVHGEQQTPYIFWSTLTLGAMIFIGSGMGLFLTRYLAITISNALNATLTLLDGETHQTQTAATSVSSASTNLAQSSTQQAAALQQTASSVEEMNAMVSKSADNAQRASETSNASSDVATRGKQAVTQMIDAIKDINTSNHNIMQQIEESNARITEITHVIAEIGNKTKVINDIVFQTKLLSFNASVEAARAGEHGKGFAVVAEEVGNLAQMSGNAAKEIAEMLNGSIEKVESIVTDTKSKVGILIADGKTKVEAGTATATQSGKVLDEIVEKVNEVNSMVGEITSATREQSQGISEITSAIGQMDQVTQQNSGISQQIASSAVQLSSQAQSLRALFVSLNQVVNGSQKEKPTPKAKVAKTKAAKTKAAKPKWTAAVPTKPSNVIPFKPPEKTPELIRETPVAPPAVGSEQIPSENDPRFKEV